MKTVSLTAYPRTLSRGPGAKRLRAQGRVPAVMYGQEPKSKVLEFDRHQLETLIQHSASQNILLDLAISEDAKHRLALVKEVQHHPMSGRVLHVDLHEVSENQNVVVMVPVESVGEAIGVKTNGGVLEHVLFKIRVRGLPKDLPEVIEVDVSHLEIGQTIHLGDIKAPPGVEIVGDKAISVISVAAPITEAQEAAVLEGATAATGEVEMLKEKKEEGAVPEEGAAAKPGEKAPAAKPGEKPAPGAKPGEKGAPAAAAEKAAAPAAAEKKKK